MQNQNNVKRTWQIMKEISSANKFKFDSFPKKLKSKETETTKRNTIFTRIGPNLTGSITNTTKTFIDHLIPS